MKTLITLFAAFFLLNASTVFASRRYCAGACQDVASYMTWQTCDASVPYYTCLCKNNAWLGTLALCVRDHCDADDWSGPSKDCANYGSVDVPSYWAVLSNATRHVADAPVDATDVIYWPVFTDNATYDGMYPTTFTFLDNMRTGTIWGWAIAVITLLVCGVAGVNHHFVAARSRRSQNGLSTKSSNIGNFLDKYVLLPPLVSLWHAQTRKMLYIPLTVPTRLEAILITLYIAANVIAIAVRYHIFSENMYWPNDDVAQIDRYIADRTGILAFANIPLMIAFAGRNNLLIWLTGSSFSTFNVFHKWIARVMMAHTVIHSICYTVIYVREGTEELAEGYAEPYLRWGAVGTVAGSFILLQAMGVFRKYAYETFLVLHVVLAIVFIIACWYHVHLIPYDEYMPWLYASIAIWGFDRIVRLARIFHYNFKRTPGLDSMCSSAEITMTAPAGLLKIVVDLPVNWPYSPGQYAFLHVCSGLKDRPWESHPFTIYLYTSKLALETNNKQKMAETASITSDKVIETHEMTFYVRPYKGMTARLAGEVLAKGPLRKRVLVEGPYGHSLKLDRFDNVSFIAGGVGITAAVPHIAHLIRSTQRLRIKINLFWIVHEIDTVQGIHDDLLKYAQQSDDLAITLFVTTVVKSEDTAAGDVVREIKEVEHDKAKRGSVHTVFGHGRPSCSQIIEELTETSSGSHIIIASGPGSLLDDCRAAAVRAISNDRGKIVYHEEQFGW